MKHEIKNVTKAQLEHLIDEYVLGFKAERNRSIMKRRLLDGITFEDLSYEYDMSVNQIKNIVYKQLEILIKHIEVG
jgi:Mor family transcriptional regulator